MTGPRSGASRERIAKNLNTTHTDDGAIGGFFLPQLHEPQTAFPWVPGTDGAQYFKCRVRGKESRAWEGGVLVNGTDEEMEVNVLEKSGLVKL
jgi:hypothetical protein